MGIDIRMLQNRAAVDEVQQVEERGRDADDEWMT